MTDTSGKPTPADATTDGQPAPLPGFIEPCLAQQADAPPQGDAWVHEIKFDGYRLQARVAGGAARLLTRNGEDWTGRFGAIAVAIGTLPCRSALIDGEAVVLDEHGVSSFSMLVSALKAGRSAAMTFYAFDLLHLDGTDLSGQTLAERKQRLLNLLPMPSAESFPVRYSDHLAGDGAAMLRQACAMGLEGIVSKRLDKPYRSGRHGVWLKIKCQKADEFVIAGYVVSAAEKEAVGALALGFFEDGRLVYAGRVGTGFSRRTARELWSQMQALRCDVSPFATRLSTAQRRGVVWLAPRLVAQVGYTGWTADHLLRHAVFQGLRDDKPAHEVGKPGASP